MEGLFLKDNIGLSPYDGDVCHHPPLLLFIFGILNDFNIPIYFVGLIFVFSDVISSLSLSDIASRWSKRQLSNANKYLKSNSNEDADDADVFVPWEFKSSLLSRVDLPFLAGICYLLNPYTISTCLGFSTASFNNLFVILSLYFALKGRSFFASLSVAMAAYLSFYPIILVLPLALLLKPNVFDESPTFSALRFAIDTSLVCGILLGVSRLLSGDWRFLQEVYGFTLMVPDLTPNIGLFWYFFTEVFKHFRVFYLFVYQYHVFIYSIPLFLRLKRHPLFLFWINVAIIAAFKSYPTLGDLALQMAFLPLILDIVKDTKYYILYACAVGIITSLMPILWHMWIYSLTGNANFYYGMNLALTLTQALFIGDALSAVLKFDFLDKGKKEKTE